MSARAAAVARGRFLRSALLALAVVGFLAHIVPLSSSGHTPFTTSTESHGPSDSDAEASHVASCDAMAARTAPTLPAPAVSVAVAAKAVSSVSCATQTVALAVAARSRWSHPDAPLFLLHASFLI